MMMVQVIDSDEAWKEIIYKSDDGTIQLCLGVVHVKKLRKFDYHRSKKDVINPPEAFQCQCWYILRISFIIHTLR